MQNNLSQSVLKNRTKFENIIRRYGHAIILQRLCTYSKGVGPYHKHPEDCPVCSGKGYWQKVEKHLVRKDIVTAGTGMPYALASTSIGLIPSEGVYFYMTYSVKPKEGDRIFEWDVANDNWNIFEVSKAADMRAHGGEILYWIAASKQIYDKE